jgi:hypothetical protein
MASMMEEGKNDLAMKFVLTGFCQSENVRHYSFQGIVPGGKRTELSVGVDLALLHKYGIPLQEAPLLCCLLLSAQSEAELGQHFVLSEGELRDRAAQRDNERTESQTKKKPAAAPLTEPTAVVRPAPGFGKVGVGLGSRTGYPWSPHFEATTKR